MSTSHRLPALICGLTAALLLAAPPASPAAQPMQQKASEPVLPSDRPAGLDAAAQKQLAQVPDALRTIRGLIEKKQWDDAARALQALLNLPTNVLVPVKQKGAGDDKEATHWLS